MNHVESLVRGSGVILELDGGHDEQHADRPRPPFLCDQPQAPAGG